MRWFAAFFLAALLVGCSPSPPKPAEGFQVAEGLELTLWAQEPDVVNPTNMAIDERGRIWVTEGVNYRRHLKGEPDLADEGDRIVILEDTNGNGRADKRTVFDQNPELRSPLGIAVLGNRVYVSQSPNLTVYTKDENDKIVSKETLLTGWGGYDHDHGLHAAVFGFDGRLYFNSGDQGFDVTDKAGARFVSSREGPYYAGAVQRIDPDGSNFTVLAHNFRNPYELAIDSFGTIWQTDNDDDGNEWTRLNYVMEGGNFGYWGPGGRRWREDHGTHFHEELPGVVPNIARTGPGSPTGLVVYEGDLLPEKYRGQLIHSEPGKRHIFTFLLSSSGAGYKMEAEKTVSSSDPNWRPSDVTVSPDGAVFIADWYDPVVGGHNMKDFEKGRIYRLAPPKYLPEAKSRVDFASENGLAAALAAPDQATRYRAHQELKLRGREAIPLLERLWSGGGRLGARALWLLADIAGPDHAAIGEALRHSDPDFRILGVRVGRFAGREIPALVTPLVEDPDPRVRRECALALQYVEGDAAIEPLARLAQGYDGQDRWYLEAWAIGARGKEQDLGGRLHRDFPGEFDTRLADFFWQLRPAGALPYLSNAVRNPRLSVDDRLRALRAIGDRDDASSARAVAAFVSSGTPEVANAAFDKLRRQLFSQWTELRRDAAVAGAIRKALADPALQLAALRLVDNLADPGYGKDVLAIAQNAQTPADTRAQAIKALGEMRQESYIPYLGHTADSDAPTPLRVAAIQGLGAARPEDLGARMEKLILAGGPNEVRSEALRVLSRTPDGLNRVLDLYEQDALPAEVRTLAANLVRMSRDETVIARAEKVLAPPADQLRGSLPANPMPLAFQIGDPEKGREVFLKKDGPRCASCHSLDSSRELAGPNLQAIGSKYDKRGLLDAILNPSAGIAPEYYVYILDTETQGLVVGVLAEDTAEQVVVRNEFGDEIRLDPGEIVSRRKSNLSMMPEDLAHTMTETELVDLLEFLSSLKGEDRSAD